MLLKDFDEDYRMYTDEIGVTEEGMIASHQIPATITATDENGNVYEVVDLELDLLWGCMCPYSIDIKIRKKVQ